MGFHVSAGAHSGHGSHLSSRTSPSPAFEPRSAPFQQVSSTEDHKAKW